MRVRPRIIVLVVLACAAALLWPSGSGAGASPSPSSLLHRVLGSCGLDLRVGYSHCNLSLLADSSGRPHASAGPTGYGYQDLRAAYGLAAAALSNGGTQTVAIVDAFDDKTAEADLGTYRGHYGLGDCTTANHCFRKVNQAGVQGAYPKNNQGWALEVSLDLDMVSAICPNCKVLLVEANNNQSTSLYAAVDTAVRLGATVVSNSYGGSETSGDVSNNIHFNHPGVAITVSSGDSGYGVQYPAASPFVTSVGGTTLTKTGSGYTESVWNGAGSGCSKYQTSKPSWQADTGCANRTVADVSAVADPNTGVAVYDSNCSSLNALGGKCFNGWGTVGGTSAAAPIIAGVYALAGNAGSLNGAQSTYTNAGSLHDVTSGSNGSCNGSYLCTAGPGYDGPTGNGTPNGPGAF